MAEVIDVSISWVECRHVDARGGWGFREGRGSNGSPPAHDLTGARDLAVADRHHGRASENPGRGAAGVQPFTGRLSGASGIERRRWQTVAIFGAGEDYRLVAKPAIQSPSADVEKSSYPPRRLS